MLWAIAIIIGYLLGAFPTGVLVGRLSGLDPRTKGSGNIGASNVTRTMGWRLGAAVLVVDVAKGALATALPLWVGGDIEHAATGGFMAVVGHCYPVWLKFNGGKGVATALGAMLVGAPVVALITALVWIAVVFITRIPALGSLLGVLIFALLTRHPSVDFPVHVMALGVALIIVVRHRSNIRVLVKRAQGKAPPPKRRRNPQPGGGGRTSGKKVNKHKGRGRGRGRGR
ncbi:MAG: glycerol-3-phosphate 1-O-acyltransferase PlsY [Bradymonadia bacterium]